MISGDMSQHSRLPVFDRVGATLAVTCVYAILATVILVWLEGLPPAVRIPLALPLLVFAPGYAAVTAFDPPARWKVGETATETAKASTLERGILSVVLSIAIVPMVAAAANFITGIDYVVVLVGVTSLTVVAAIVAFVRRPTARSIGPAGGTRGRGILRGDWIGALKDTLTDGPSLLAISIVVLLLAASASVSFAGGADDSLGTEFYLANSTETPGNPVGSGDAIAFDLRIDHNGADDQRFAIVVLRDEGDGMNAEAANRTWTEVTRTSTIVGPDETAAQSVRLDPSPWPANTTVRFLLYQDDVDQTTDPDSAHRTLEVRLNEPT